MNKQQQTVVVANLCSPIANIIFTPAISLSAFYLLSFVIPNNTSADLFCFT